MLAGAASHLGGQARLLNCVKSLGNRTSVTYGTTVTVVQRLLAGDTLRGVEVEHLGEQVERERVGLREELLERHAGLDGEGANVVLGL